MTDEKLTGLVPHKVELELFGEVWNVEFRIRNFAALRKECGVAENDLLQGLINGEVSKIPYAIWAATLVFATPFDPTNPTKIEKQIPLEKLFELSLADLQGINDKLVKAMEDYLPKAPKGGAKKKPMKAAMK